MKKIAVSIGDVNGIGLEIALKAHNAVKNNAGMMYFVDSSVVECASKHLNIPIPSDFTMIDIKDSCSKELQNLIRKESKNIHQSALITPFSENKINKFCGEYSFVSVKKALDSVRCGDTNALLTLPIHKKAWELAEVPFVGHTDFLSNEFHDKGIMMLGCEKMFVALFSDHIPLSQVPISIDYDCLVRFFMRFAKYFRFNQALVLGLNPHAGDSGVLGSEDFIIQDAINIANKKLKAEKFIGIISPDIAFSPNNRAKFNTFVAMYHDQGLIALKALYFDESINITLGLPILRASVDHGVAFDIAYQNKASIKSYLNAVNFIIKSS